MYGHKKLTPRLRRRRRVRRKISGTAARPRLSVFRSLRHIYAQLVDDDAGRTLVAASSLDAELREKVNGGDVAGAAAVGELFAQKALAAGFKEVVFDRGGYKYHGRVKAFAESARKGGLKF